MGTKLYTEEQLLDIAKKVAEKACATSLSDEYVKSLCDDYGHSKLFVDVKSLHDMVEDDEVERVDLRPSKFTRLGHTYLKN